jgi:hypothetical protein
MSSSILQTILDIAPKVNPANENEFIAYFDKKTNHFNKPVNLPNYLDSLWENLQTELGKSQFLKSQFFDFK